MYHSQAGRWRGGMGARGRAAGPPPGTRMARGMPTGRGAATTRGTRSRGAGTGAARGPGLPGQNHDVTTLTVLIRHILHIFNPEFKRIKVQVQMARIRFYALYVRIWS